MTSYKRIPKLELARSQLEVALRFYMLEEEYPAVITLAGAAEEVLGKIAEKKGFEPALKRNLRELLAAYKHVWGEEAQESDFAQLHNKARNELKHLCSGNEMNLDYEKEAAELLSRALENFLLCTGSPHPSQYIFTDKMLANWEGKQDAV